MKDKTQERKETAKPNETELGLDGNVNEYTPQRIKVVHGHYATMGVVFPDAVYTDSKLYMDAEVFPYLESGTPVTHPLSIDGLCGLIGEKMGWGRTACLFEMGLRQYPQQQEKLRRALENLAYQGAVRSIVLNTCFPFDGRADLAEECCRYDGISNKTKEALRSIACEWGIIGEKDNETGVYSTEAYIPEKRKKIMEMENNSPQTLAIETFRNLPYDNAMKNFVYEPWKVFFRRNKDKLSLSEILGVIEQYDPQLFPDKHLIYKKVKDILEELDDLEEV